MKLKARDVQSLLDTLIHTAEGLHLVEGEPDEDRDEVEWQEKRREAELLAAAKAMSRNGGGK